MKKTFLLLTALALLAGCEWLADGDNDKEGGDAPTLTIENKSLYDLTDVRWANKTFTSPDQDRDLLKTTSSTQAGKYGDSGYIVFLCKDIDIELRTFNQVNIETKTFTFTDNTLVVEGANPGGSPKALSAIHSPSAVVLMRNLRTVAKDEDIYAGEQTLNSQLSIPFIIKNTGKGTLTFTRNEPVESSDPAFTVKQPASSEIAPEDSLDFMINFNPTIVQPYTTTITVSSNDPNGNFTFTITGKGVALKPILKISQGETEIPQSGTLNMGEIITTLSGTREITLKNTGEEVLTIDIANITLTGTDAAAFVKLTDPGANISPGRESRFTIQCTPVKQGENNAILTIPTNDDSRNPAVTYLTATGLSGGSVLELRQGETFISNNDLTPFDFGQVEVGANKSLTFTIQNTGNIPLQLSGTPKVESTNAAFTIPSQPAASSIAPGETAPFIIRYAPSAEVDDTAEITIFNNSASLQFTFKVKGNGYIKKPQITLKQNVDILNHGEYDFGDVSSGVPKDVVFTVGNSGDAALTFVTVNDNRINLTGNTAGLFTVIQQPAVTTNVIPGSTATFTIRFSPVSDGNFNATVNIKTNSKTDDEFVFTVKGSGYVKKPQITVKQGNTNILNYGEYNFGLVSSDAPKDVVFTIGNSGDAALTFIIVNGNRINLTDNATETFTVTQQPAATTNVIPGNTVTFTIRFSPVNDGNFNATVNIKTNSRTDDEFVFTVSGRGMIPKPIIGIFYNNAEILQNGTIDGGETFTKVPIEQEITIKNTGTALLTLGTITITGADASAFSLATSPSSNISVGTDSRLSIRCTPAKLGENSATITIAANDPARLSAVFHIKVTGTLVAPPSGLSVSSLTSDSVTLSWNVVAGATGYFIYRSTSSDGTYTKITSSAVTGLSYTDTGRTASTKYYYKVSSNSGVGEGAQSAYVSATTQIGTSATITLAVQNDVAISTQSVSIPRGESRIFQVMGDYTSYQWYLNGSTIIGATAASYTLNTASMKMGIYELAVMVSTSAGAKLSGSCRVIVE
jgi:hypothetical protein